VNPTIIIGLLGLGVFIGDVFDFAIDKLKAKNVAADLWVAANAAGWDSSSLAAAFRFSKGYLDRLFGARLWSLRVLLICVCVSILSTDLSLEVTFKTILRLKPSSEDRVYYLVTPVINGTIDALSLIWSRRIINGVVSRGDKHRFARPTLALCAIAYIAAVIGLYCMFVETLSLGVYSGHPFNALGAYNTSNVALNVVIALVCLPLLVIIFIPWLILWGRSYSPVLLAMAPAAFTTVILIITLAIPFALTKTRRFSKPLVIRTLDVFASLPSWSGRAIGLFCAGLIVVFRVNNSQ
jgi:hypothetical protein